MSHSLPETPTRTGRKRDRLKQFFGLESAEQHPLQPSPTPILTLAAAPIIQGNAVLPSISSRPGLHLDGQKGPGRFRPGISALDQILKIATAATAAFPPAQSVVGGASAALQSFATVFKNEEQREEVQKNLKQALKRLEKCREKELSLQLEQRLSLLCTELTKDLESNDEAMNQSWWKKWAEGASDDRREHYLRLSSRLSMFLVDTVVDMHGTIETLLKVSEDIRMIAAENHEALSRFRLDLKMKDLGLPQGVDYNTGPPHLRGPCTEMTREKILHDLMRWATDDDARPVFWLSGMAGTGKTTIAYSFCEQLKKRDLLCSSFFCSRSVKSSTDPRAILPALSFHLASQSRDSLDRLSQALSDHLNVDIRNQTPKDQFEGLISGPAEALSTSGPTKRRIVIYDGLDEIDVTKSRELGDVISLLLQNLACLPIKIFISSREEDEIKRQFERSSAYDRLLLHEDIEQRVVEADIERYMCQRLSSIVEMTPVPGMIRRLVQRAGRLFVYAAAACSYIEARGPAHRRVLPSEMVDRLSNFLQDTSTPTGASPYALLDDLYRQILGSATSFDFQYLWPVLLTVLSAQQPLTGRDICVLLGTPAYEVMNVLSSLQAVLTGSGKAEEHVTIFHTSFRDFLNDESRGGEFSEQLERTHSFLLRCCVQTMDRYFANGRVVDRSPCTRISEVDVPSLIPPSLAYVCMSFLPHLIHNLDSPDLSPSDIQSIASNFFDRHVLYWIECMAWLGKLRDGVKLLEAFERSERAGADLISSALDARRVIRQSVEILNTYPLEIYSSALVWLPLNSQIRVKFFLEQDWRIVHGLPNNWDVWETTIRFKGHSLVAPEDVHESLGLVAGHFRNGLAVWDMETAAIVMEVNSSGYSLVRFSPLGVQVAAFSNSDHKVCLFDVQSGNMVSTRPAEEVIILQFSHNGSRILWATLNSPCITIWDITGSGQDTVIQVPSTERLHAVCFSHDDERLASISMFDGSVRIWNAMTGCAEKVVTEIMEHGRDRTDIQFIHDNRWLLTSFSSFLGDPGLIQIWDVSTGKELKRLDSDTISCVPAFGQSGMKVYYGCWDGAIGVWDVETGTESKIPGRHDNLVQFVAVSRDGRRLFSGSQETFRICTIEEALVISHTPDDSENFSLVPNCVSRDGQDVILRSNSGSFRRFDVAKGKEVMKISAGSLSTEFLCLSHDGACLKQVIFASKVGVERCDVTTGQIANLTSMKVSCIDLSQNQRWLAVGSREAKVEIWDLEATMCTRQINLPLHFWVHGLGISKDGTFIVCYTSGSSSGSLWDIQTGQQVWSRSPEPWSRSDAGRGFHFPKGKLYFSCDETLLANFSVAGSLESSQLESDDEIRRVWLMKTGEEVERTRTIGVATKTNFYKLDHLLTYDRKTDRLRVARGHTASLGLWVPPLYRIDVFDTSQRTICFSTRHNSTFIIQYIGDLSHDQEHKEHDGCVHY